MANSFIHTIYKFYRNNQVKIFCIKLIFIHKFNTDYIINFLSSAKLNMPFFFKILCYLLKSFFIKASIYKKCFCCIAGSCILCLGIKDNIACLLYISVLINVCMTDTISMTHNRNLGVIHNILNELVRASRDNKVYALITFKKFIYLTMSCNLYHTAFWCAALYCRPINKFK